MTKPPLSIYSQAHSGSYRQPSRKLQVKRGPLAAAAEHVRPCMPAAPCCTPPLAPFGWAHSVGTCCSSTCQVGAVRLTRHLLLATVRHRPRCSAWRAAPHPPHIFPVAVKQEASASASRLQVFGGHCPLHGLAPCHTCSAHAPSNRAAHAPCAPYQAHTCMHTPNQLPTCTLHICTFYLLSSACWVALPT